MYIPGLFLFEKITGMTPKSRVLGRYYILRLWRDCSTNKFLSLRFISLSLTNKNSVFFAGEVQFCKFTLS
jgi:hypothetical protein